jgi:hypothetical protein
MTRRDVLRPASSGTLQARSMGFGARALVLAILLIPTPDRDRGD